MPPGPDAISILRCIPRAKPIRERLRPHLNSSRPTIQLAGIPFASTDWHLQAGPTEQHAMGKASIQHPGDAS
jgi:hypothetical protein